MNTKLLLGALVAVLVMVTVATMQPAATTEDYRAPAAPAKTAATGGNIESEALRNATYGGIYEQPITLTGGLRRGEADCNLPTTSSLPSPRTSHYTPKTAARLTRSMPDTSGLSSAAPAASE